MKTVLLLATLVLAGCGPDIKLGAGTIKQADVSFQYEQDNHYLFDTYKTFLHAKGIEGYHCDEVDLYTDGGGFVMAMSGLNCHAPQDESLCAKFSDQGFIQVPCN